MTASLDFVWWEKQEPATFLAFDWGNASRELGCSMALLATKQYGTLLEVGPGSGVDYARSFRPAVLARRIKYIGYEPTQRFYRALTEKYPEANWGDVPLSMICPRSADVVYIRAVLEHQPTLEPALTSVCEAARAVVVIDWYRPPADVATHEMYNGVWCHTFAIADVRAVIERAGFRLDEIATVSGSPNEVWRLTRKAPT